MNKESQKQVLVSGCCGFIGSHVSEALLKRGDIVYGVDQINDYYNVVYKEENLSLLKKYDNFLFFKKDISDYDSIKNIFSANKITHIAHLAARAGVRPSIIDPFLYQEANIKGSMVLLDLATKYNIENFVLTSSSSVYGNSLDIPFKENDNATDKPISPYAATKKACELLAYTYHSLYKLNVNIIRPFTVYGERGRPDMAPWLFLLAALTGKEITKFGDGSTRRDYTYIADFVKGFIAAIDRKYGFEIFNLGNSNTISLNEALAIVSKVTNKELNIIQKPMQLGDVNLTYADLTKSRAVLDYNPQTSFEEGMTVFKNWFLEFRKDLLI